MDLVTTPTCMLHTNGIRHPVLEGASSDKSVFFSSWTLRLFFSLTWTDFFKLPGNSIKSQIQLLWDIISGVPKLKNARVWKNCENLATGQIKKHTHVLGCYTMTILHGPDAPWLNLWVTPHPILGMPHIKCTKRPTSFALRCNDSMPATSHKLSIAWSMVWKSKQIPQMVIFVVIYHGKKKNTIITWNKSK